MKTRKLYQVRNNANSGLLSGRSVGHKCRLVPYAAARRIAKRLRASGMFITIDPILVNLTLAQASYLDRRYA
jgi:hypothetical protein